MRLNSRLVQVSQLLQQFKFDICHKPNKEHIIPDILSQLASTNTRYPNLQHLEINILFIYNATLVKIYPARVS